MAYQGIKLNDQIIMFLQSMQPNSMVKKAGIFLPCLKVHRLLKLISTATLKQ